MGRLLALLVVSLVTVSGRVQADGQRERAAILAVDLGGGAAEFLRPKAAVRVQDGLGAAGYEVVSLDDLHKRVPADLHGCRSGHCLGMVAKAVEANALVLVSVTRKDDSTIIVMRLLDPQSGEAFVEIHE